ncbi:hypothetical protein GWI33_003780, partial [Rhynchophorus ferrugineus]
MTTRKHRNEENAYMNKCCQILRNIQCIEIFRHNDTN